MTKSFSYSVLKYRPSYFLDEQINIGLLFIFPEEGKVVFESPKKLKRVRQFHPEGNMNYLKQYLRVFQEKAKTTDAKSFFQNSDSFINKFIPKDANSLFFSEFKKGQYFSSKKTLDYYYSQYFQAYETKQKKKKQ